MASSLCLAPEMVESAHRVISDKITRTQLLTNSKLSQLASTSTHIPQGGSDTQCSMTLYLKCENEQRTGSFKYRGVWHKLLLLPKEVLQRGLVLTSSGNHAVALASAAHTLSRLQGYRIPVHVVMPLNASSLKVRNAMYHGAQVVRSGDSWSEREAAVETLRRAHGLTVISSANDIDVILGQGTIGLEMVQQIREQYGAQLDCIILPCGSGGLLSGVGIALRNHDVKIFGAEPLNGADDGARGLLSGVRIEKVTSDTIADGLRCPIGETAWEIIRDPSYIENIFTVSDQDIYSTMCLVEETMQTVIEPSAAVSLAIALFNKSFRDYVLKLGRHVHIGVVLSGGNFEGLEACQLRKLINI